MRERRRRARRAPGGRRPRAPSSRRGRPGARSRREAGLQLGREAEPVGGEPDGVLAVGRLRERREHLADALEGALPVRQRRVDLDPDAVRQVVLGGRRAAPRSRRGRRPDRFPAGARRRGCRSPARRRAPSRAASPPARRRRRRSRARACFVRRCSSRSCASVSAVPIDGDDRLEARPGAARSRRCCPRRHRAILLRDRGRARGRGRRAGRPCGRGRPRAS